MTGRMGAHLVACLQHPSESLILTYGAICVAFRTVRITALGGAVCCANCSHGHVSRH